MGRITARQAAKAGRVPPRQQRRRLQNRVRQQSPALSAKTGRAVMEVASNAKVHRTETAVQPRAIAGPANMPAWIF